ncbi:MAG TPA: hypothetical protein VNO70_08995 [Blastocatellia bacterium]|nr:hypothetical protein [Blastocatellia bacterium]
MSMTKILLVVLLTLNACGQSLPEGDAANPNNTPAVQSDKSTRGENDQADVYGPPVHLADLEEPAVKESSGLAASRRNPGLFWTHNDSGDGPFLYAFDRQGRRAGVWEVAGARAIDWEDMAAGPGPERGRAYLYVGDIGDNARAREEVIVYRVAEPAIAAQDSAASQARKTEPAEAIHLKYPDGKHDAEALLVHPATGDIYIITKAMGAPARVYQAASPTSPAGVITLTLVGEVRLPNAMAGLITGGDIAPDGRRVILCDYFGAYEMALPDGSADNFGEIWKQQLMPVKLAARRQGESICYRLDGKAILTTSEGRHCPLYEAARR